MDKARQTYLDSGSQSSGCCRSRSVGWDLGKGRKSFKDHLESALSSAGGAN